MVEYRTFNPSVVGSSPTGNTAGRKGSVLEEKAGKENYSIEIESFLETLYGDQRGYIYVPTKNPETEYFQPYFFKWPEHRVSVTTHILNQSKESDVYLAPSLFKAPSDKKQAWKGSNYVWVEFDGNAPKTLPEGIPEPSMRVQSSVDKHEHWYWKLDAFEKNSQAVEGLAKSLTYTLDADKSGWDCTQILRPPGSLHQESKRRVQLLTKTDSVHGFADFRNLVVAPESAVADTSFEDVPDVKEVVAKYKWDDEAYDLFNKSTQAVGSRSSAMTRLGFHCIEMGMSNEECYAVLINADDRWGKYKHRNPADRAKRLIGIINHCRGKKSLDAELSLNSQELFVSLGDFLSSDVKVKWLYENFILEQGLGIISAQPGVGKTTLSFRLGLNAVLSKDYLVWKYAAAEGRKVGFLSLEMGSMECKKFLEDMLPSYTEEEQKVILKEFKLLPLGYSMPLHKKEHQQNILDEIDKHDIDFLIIDSLKAATGLDEKKTDEFFNWVNEHIREKRKCAVWLVHHNRKPTNTDGPRKPKGLDDLYGDTFISAHPTTVISLWRKTKSEIEVMPFKIRMAEEHDHFVIKRKPNLNFDILNKVDLHEEPEKEEKEPKSGNGRVNGFFG